MSNVGDVRFELTTPPVDTMSESRDSNPGPPREIQCWRSRLEHWLYSPKLIGRSGGN